MHILNTYKFKIDQINSNREKGQHRYLDAQWQLTLVSGRIWSNFKLIQALMHTIITCKYEKQMRKSGNSVFPIISLCGLFQTLYMAANSAVRGRIWPNFSCMPSLPVSMKRIGRKTAEKKWQHRLFRRSRAGNSVVRGRIWSNFELIQALMYAIVTCKYEKDPIKNS